MHRVVVGIDGSQTAKAAFREAIFEATARDATVDAIHVVPTPISTMADPVRIDLDILQKSGEQTLDRIFDEMRSEYGGEFPVPVNGKVIIGHVGVQVIKAASDSGEGPADLVVLGSRGLGGFRGLLLGSVTTYAVHHLTCKLLIVPAVEED